MVPRDAAPHGFAHACKALAVGARGPHAQRGFDSFNVHTLGISQMMMGHSISSASRCHRTAV